MRKKKNGHRVVEASNGGVAPPSVPMDSWMLQKMKDKAWGSKKLNEIIMPGSHNAATNVIEDKTISGRFAGFAAKTQDISPYEQMKVRLLKL